MCSCYMESNGTRNENCCLLRCDTCITDVLKESNSFIFRVCQALRRHIPEHSRRGTHRHENFKPHEIKIHLYGNLGIWKEKAVVHFQIISFSRRDQGNAK
jgi:hypothetical protein